MRMTCELREKTRRCAIAHPGLGWVQGLPDLDRVSNPSKNHWFLDASLIFQRDKTGRQIKMVFVQNHLSNCLVNPKFAIPFGHLAQLV